MGILCKKQHANSEVPSSSLLEVLALLCHILTLPVLESQKAGDVSDQLTLVGWVIQGNILPSYIGIISEPV